MSYAEHHNHLLVLNQQHQGMGNTQSSVADDSDIDEAGAMHYAAAAERLLETGELAGSEAVGSPLAKNSKKTAKTTTNIKDVVVAALEAVKDREVGAEGKKKKKKKKKSGRQTSQEEESAQALLALNKGSVAGEDDEEDDEAGAEGEKKKKRKDKEKKKKKKKQREDLGDEVEQEAGGDDDIEMIDAVDVATVTSNTAAESSPVTFVDDELAYGAMTGVVDSGLQQQLEIPERVTAEHLAAHIAKSSESTIQVEEQLDVGQRLINELQNHTSILGADGFASYLRARGSLTSEE